MRLDFRIDWGYSYLYSRRHYHPVYQWDGELNCEGGEIRELRQLDYPVIWFGPGHCAKETLLPGNAWKSRTKRGMAGIRVLAEAEQTARFSLHTLSGDFEFSVRELLDSGRIVFPVGPKYLNCNVIVTRTNYLWFRPAPAPGETVWEADDLPLERHDWARMRTAWLAPGKTVEVEAEIPSDPDGDVHAESVLHLVAMAAPGYTPGDEKQVHDDFPLTVSVDGVPVAEGYRYFREHDTFMQMLEDVWLRFPCAPGRHRISVRNGNPRFFLLLSRVTLRRSVYRHLQLSLPEWALAGEPLAGRIYATRADRAAVRWPRGETELELAPGWNEFPFKLSAPGRRIEVSAGSSRGTVDAVYALGDETPEVTVGYDMTVVPHDDSGVMDWLLDYTWRTRLGNLVVFRSFQRTAPESNEYADVSPELLRRWAEFCRDHRIYVEAATSFDDGALVEGAGAYLHSVGRHEWPGAVYAFDPNEKWGSADMKEAMEHFLAYLKPEIDRAHRAAPRAAFGDASGGHRYCYLAGADFLRTETMVPHTQHICSQARPAAEALGSGEWGVHIAIQHPVQPYFENHLGIYFLSLFQAWMMGASMIYEEDSLFELFKEERQAWDDALTRGKRDMTRAFFRFVKTHPRRGKPVRKIAFLEGRYAAPFNGFICDSEQTPDYSVWGRFGNPAPEWGHRQPEKCRQLLDVLMPGASTAPLRQRFDQRRFFFSGTPYGDFDETPIEAKADYFRQYSLLLNLGWNSCIAEDYEKLKSFVEQGGTLFTGLPEFSTRTDRGFLRDMADLRLWNGGDLSELCGVKIRGRAEAEFHGQWNCAGRENFPEPALSAQPSSSPEEDGPCRLADVELCGGVPVVWDADSGLPLVVEHSFGRGKVYLLTAYAYPGHEKLQPLSAAVLAKLASRHRGDVYVEDPSGEVFWSRWVEGNGAARLFLLNTDWTVPGNAKPVTVRAGKLAAEVTVYEREPKTLLLLPFAVVEIPPSVHAELLGCDGNSARLRLHGTGAASLVVHRNGSTASLAVGFGAGTATELTL